MATRTDKLSAHADAVVLDARWARVLARDKAADGLFWYSVATTGIYCRPSCPSRVANPRNVGFHASPAAAAAAGYRPCRRCNPGGPPAEADRAALVARACRTIGSAEAPLRLAELARALQPSPFHFHRLFRSVTGVTPRAYAAARQAERVRARLGQAGTVAEAIHDAGFGSSGRFYACSTGMLGMTPGRYRSGGTEEVLQFAVGRCALGAVLVASSTRGVASMLLGDDPDALLRDLQDRYAAARLVGGDAEYEALVARVAGLVEAPHQEHGLPLDIRGTLFQ